MRDFQTNSGSAMPVPYSEDLRWRVVWLYLTKGLSYKEISDLLFISEKSVERYIKQYLNTNSVTPTEYKHGQDKLLTDFEQLTVLQLLLVNPSMYLQELCDELEEATGKRVHPSTIYAATMSPRVMVSMAFSTVTQDDCLGYIRHAGYIY